MIGFLRGQVAALKADYCLLDVNGVGYRVFVAGSTRNKLRLKEEAQLFTYMNVYQDGITLYGFASEEEYDIFQLLIGVSGIGPKVALGILSAITVESLCKAIQNKQATVLTKLPGIGKKSAERLILELKDKVAFAAADDVEEILTLDLEGPTGDDMMSEAQAALVALGYSQAEIAPVLKKATKCKTTEEVIKLALKQLNKF
ncbi:MULTISPECIES: Holliday junction branch migration protein RuvA [Selenomonas]|jgi:Holliday junction DNA helicase RuvA|uniref:Holliday junction branch migration complex subunit RuvA n=1 Tax=Selenomonas ruminantium TaxID=971 RepID=A0A1K1PDA8_SELRU|nr:MULTISPECIES: Holliday junction branch migration protein RuvA [Selenomonas]MBE6084011.1 Holliday junction branch migration protein RuvA [Selenomonas ruminantium]SFA91914.1 Holliday junction DNA helicase subunit RuvA [Selenomonas ruminantium]SFW45473.1 Holliday junction DNA helicase subunit RuvA [Selenomonas ruminantium]